MKTVFLDIYQNDLETYVHMKTYIWMFIAALVIIAKTWKQPRYHSVSEWTNKQVHPDNGILFRDKKRGVTKPQ